MRFLADESCDFAVVRALRAAGHAVVAVVEIARQATDDEIAQLAVREDRLLLTEDKDFGTLVYAQAKQSGGVILIRFPAERRSALSAAVVSLVNDQAEGLVAASPWSSLVEYESPGCPNTN